MRVLALDLSYVMSPSISQYDIFPADKQVDTEKHWDLICHTLGKNSFQFSLERLMEMTASFSKAIKNVERDQVYLVDYQSDVLPVLMGCDQLIIHNVDHCHDMLVSPIPGDDNAWITELDRQKLVNEYVWWRNRNSKNVDDYHTLNCLYNETTFSKRRPMKNPDLIIVSRSPHMVSREVHCLFSIFEHITHAWFDSH